MAETSSFRSLTTPTTPVRNHSSSSLLDVMRRERRRDKTAWKSLRDKLRLKRTATGWISSNPIPTLDNHILTPDNDSHRFNRLGFLLTNSETNRSSRDVSDAAEEAAEREGRLRLGTVLAAEREPPRMSLMELLEDNDGHMYELSARDEVEVEGRDGCDGGGEAVAVTGAAELGCCVCMVRSKGAAFIPCGHTFCRLCSRELWVQRGNCPLCNTAILQVLVSGEQKSSWPTMRFDVSPYRTHHFSKQFRTARNPNNFLKGLKWSPDGSCFLASSEDNTLSLFHLPQDGGDSNGYGVPVPEEDSYGASLLVNEGESVYDFCWYPYMSVSDPLTCVFATSTRDHPIHLWDSTSGELRCTYRAYDAMDEITAAFSVGFNPDGTKIFAGYNSSIRVFDLHRPGRDFRQYSTLQKNKEGQAGILSTLAFSPTNSGMLAVGSYGQTTGIYREDNMELLYVLHGQEGGVTHVQFSKDGNYLYTGGRKDPYILCWDIRKSVEIVYKLYRATENTNQRVFFDIEPCGRHLGTGGQDGLVHMYDLQTGNWVSGYQAASDTVNAFSFHPYLPMAATSSGHRRFAIPDDDDGEDKNELQLKADENCVSLWSFYVEDNTYDENNGVASESHLQNVTEEIVLT